MLNYDIDVLAQKAIRIIIISVAIIATTGAIFLFFANNASAGDWQNSVSVEARDRLFLSELQTIKETTFHGWAIQYLGSIRLSGFSGQEQGVDIFTRDGKSPIFSLREFYLESPDGKISIGKQLFNLGNGIEFNFADTNLFGVRDQSLSPWDILNDERRLGDWGVAWSASEKLQLVAKFAEPPILALDSENSFTRELPLGLHYGDAEADINYAFGFRYMDSVDWVDWDLQFQYGVGNAVTDIFVSQVGEVRPVIAEQTAISLSGELDSPEAPFGLIFRGNASVYFQSGLEDFALAEIEAERILEFSDGSNSFVSVGLASSFDFGSGSTGYPGLDLRRIYEGGAVMVTAEYEQCNLLFKFRSVYNFSDGVYISPSVAWSPTDAWEAEVGWDYVNGKNSFSQTADVFSIEEKNSGVFMKVTWFF